MYSLVFKVIVFVFTRCNLYYLQIALEGLRITIPPGISAHLAKLIKICMNEDPGKRPTFDMVLPILDKMKR
jgi:integrin-linked kinase